MGYIGVMYRLLVVHQLELPTGSNPDSPVGREAPAVDFMVKWEFRV